MENIRMTLRMIDMLKKNITEAIMKDPFGTATEKATLEILSEAQKKIEALSAHEPQERNSTVRTEKIYTDGACSGNPGPGGWGLVCITDGDESHPFRTSRGYRKTTNNRMEIMAVLHALDMPRTARTDIEIISDSQYVTNAINKGWLDKWVAKEFAGTANADLWDTLYVKLNQIRRKHNVTFTWVKGHAGNRWNEMADRLAVKASTSYNPQLDIDQEYETNIQNN